jgi:hypothetical protein
MGVSDYDISVDTLLSLSPFTPVGHKLASPLRTPIVGDTLAHFTTHHLLNETTSDRPGCQS